MVHIMPNLTLWKELGLSSNEEAYFRYQSNHFTKRDKGEFDGHIILKTLKATHSALCSLKDYNVYWKWLFMFLINILQRNTFQLTENSN